MSSGVSFDLEAPQQMVRGSALRAASTLKSERVKTVIAVAAILCLGATGAGRETQIRTLRACEKAQLVPTTDWIRLNRGDGFALQLPPCFEPATDTPRYVHGGKRWRCGAATVEVVWGMWGPGWYLTGMIHEPIISAFGGGETNLPLLTTIAYSGRLSVARGPNR